MTGVSLRKSYYVLYIELEKAQYTAKVAVDLYGVDK